MSWFALLPWLLIVAGALWLPGLLLALTLRATPFTAFAIAPAVSGFLIASLALVAGLTGVGFGPGWILALIVALTPAYAITLLRCPEARPRSSPRTAAPIAAGIATGAVLLGLSLKEVLRTPIALGQNFDNMFHQNALRWILDTGEASPMTLGHVAGDGGGFYPALWHEVAALPLLTLGREETTAATSALIFVAACGVWVTGCVYLAHTLLPGRWVPLLAAGVLAASFPAFPFIPLGWGPLYPNFLGQALLPALVGLLARVLGLGHPRPVGLPRQRRVLPAILLIPAVGGVALCHPNVLVSGLIISFPMVAAWAWRGLDRRQWWGRFRWILFAGYTVGLLVAWRILRPPEWAVGYWQARHDISTAVGQIVLQNPLTGLPAWPVAICALVGAYATLARRRHRWLLASHLIVSGLFVVVSAFPSGAFRTALTGVWYNDSPRLAALLPVTAVPLAVLGVDHLARWAYASVRARRRVPLWSLPVAALGATALLIALTQPSAYLAETVDDVGSTYRLTDQAPLLTRDEVAVLQAVPDHVAPDEVIAVHPWAGGPLVYAYANRHPTARHGFHPDTAELGEIHRHLKEAATRPELCTAARAMNVRWALDFGMDEVNGERHGGYEGFENLAGSPGFTEAFRSGKAALLRLDACD